MKFIIYFILTVIAIPFIYCQNLDHKAYPFPALQIESKLDSTNFFLSYYEPISFFSENLTNFKKNSKELNIKLFSKLEFNKNTYTDYSNYLRGCNPLSNGITNPVNSGDLMLSMVIDNFVNNVLFKGKGVFFRN